MKKTLLSLVVILTITLQSYAQEKRGYIGISIGPSIPMGDLSSKDVDNESAGWANTGAIFDISFAYKLGKGNFGLTALLRGQSNPTDTKAIANEFENQNPSVYWTVDGGNWGMGGLMFGGFSSVPISQKATFDTRAMIGFLSANSPQLTIAGAQSGTVAWIKQDAATATSFSYLIGAGFKFDLGSKVYLLTNLDYLGAKPEFSNVKIAASDGSRSKETFSQTIGSLNIGVGIAFKL